MASRCLPILALTALLGLSACTSKGNLNRAQVLLAADKPEEAIRLLDRTLPDLDLQHQAVGYSVLGDALAKLGNVGDAFTAYQTALAVDPANVEAAQKVSALLISTGNADKALPLTETLTARFPNDPKMLALRAAALNGIHNFQEAEATYRRAVSLDPQDAELSVSLAEVLLHLDQVDEARNVLLASTRSSGESAAWLALARLEEQNGNAEAAESAYRSAVRSKDDPVTNFRLAQFLQRASKLAEAEVVLRHLDDLNGKALATADFDLQRGQQSQALQGYARRIKSFLSSPEKRTEDSGRVASRMVEAALAGSQPNQSAETRLVAAKSLLNQHRREIDPGTRAMLETEIALFADDLPIASRTSIEALREAPDASAAHYLRGVFLARIGERGNAVQEWQLASEHDNHVPSRLMLAGNALTAGELTVAEEYSAGVLRDEPANLQALLVYARVLEKQGRLDAADAIVQRALNADPASAEAYVISGTVALHRGLDGAALIAFEKALIFDQKSQPGIDGLLKIFSKGSPNATAIHKLEAMAEASPRSATLLEVAGRLYEMIGRKQEAKEAFHRALQVDSARPTVLLALWKLGVQPASDTSVNASIEPNATVQRYEAALEKGDRSGITANNLAYAYAASGQRLDRALELAVDAVHSIPEKPEPLDTLGLVLLKMKQYSTASNAFERALDLEPDRAAREQITLHLADAYEASGLTDKARELRASLGKPRG